RIPAARLHGEERPEMVDELVGEGGGVDAGLEDGVERGENAARVALLDGADERVYAPPGRGPEEGRDVVGPQILPLEGEELVEDRLRVAHRPAGGAGDGIEDGVIGLQALAVEDLLQAPHDVGRGDAPELEGLAARDDRVGELVDQ